MKYLRHINEESGEENIKDDINDMLYELRDEGFDCEINDSIVISKYMSIHINKSGRSFLFNDVADCIHRIFDYVYEKGCVVKYNFQLERSKYDGDFDSIINKYKVHRIYTIFISIQFGIIYRSYKHIKPVLEDKLFENKYSSANLSQKDLIRDINDILLELKDVGFTIFISDKFIRISKPPTSFNYDVVDEYIERLKDYLGKKFIRIDIQLDTRTFKTKSFFGIDRILGKYKNISGIKIEYNSMPKHIEKYIDDYLKGK
jgi:uncharacterized protein (UPF0335 family)